jgi:hypothetical protein
MNDLAALAARVAALEDERSVLATLHAYGHSIGRGDVSAFLDCFVDEGVFEVHRQVVLVGGKPSHPHPDVRSAGGPTVRFEGREGQKRFIAGHPAPPDRWHKHMVIDPLIQLSGVEASAVSFFARLDAGPDGHPHLTAFGRYIDHLRRCDDGRWRFVHRLAEVEARGPDPR